MQTQTVGDVKYVQHKIDLGDTAVTHFFTVFHIIRLGDLRSSYSYGHVGTEIVHDKYHQARMCSHTKLLRYGTRVKRLGIIAERLVRTRQAESHNHKDSEPSALIE